MVESSKIFKKNMRTHANVSSRDFTGHTTVWQNSNKNLAYENHELAI